MTRPYTHPDNIGSDGNPIMSENAWAIFEAQRMDTNDNSGLFNTLWNEIQKKASAIEVANLATKIGCPHEALRLTEILIANHRAEMLVLVTTHSVKIDAVKDAIDLLCDKAALSAEDKAEVLAALN